MKKIVLIFITLAVFSLTSWAYAPPSSFILKKIASRRVAARTFRIKSVISRLEDGHASGAKVKVITAVDLASHALKSRAFTEGGVELYSVERSINSISSAQKANRGEVSAVVDALLFEGSTDSLIRVVRDAGIPIVQESELKSELTADERSRIEKISLVRGSVVERSRELGNERGHEFPKVYWALGVESSAAARKTALQAEQIWIEKDTFHVARLLMNASSEDSGMTEVQFEQTKTVRDVAFPRLLKVSRVAGGKPDAFLQEDVTDVATQVDLKSDLKGSRTGWSDASASLDPATKELIQNYYRYLR